MNGLDPAPNGNRQSSGSVWWMLAAAVATAIVLIAVFAFRDNTESASASLVNFDNCDELLAKGEQALEASAAGSVSRGAAEEAIPDVEFFGPETESSTAAGVATLDSGSVDDSVPVVEAGGSNEAGTNVQEADVDEPDWVKVADDTLAVIGEEYSLLLVDVSDPARPQTVGVAYLGEDLGIAQSEDEPASDYVDGPYSGEMLVYDDRLIVTRQAYSETGPVASVIEFDISDRENPTLVRRSSLEGQIVSSRLTGSTMRIVLSTAPDYASAQEATSPGDWMPSYSTAATNGQVLSGQLVGCGQVSHPPEVTSPGLTVIATIDMDQGLPAMSTEAVMGGGDKVYASTDALYVVTSTFDPVALERFDAANEEITRIHRFDTSEAGETNYTGSGEVPGHMLDQWSMSDHNGYLRVATTTTSRNWSTDNRVTILDTEGPEMEEVGRVEGLGPNESIYAVRYFGDYAFVVTFRETDPLYALDLSDPANPVNRGELKIPGYSSYLHPVGDNLLLGVGQDADNSGWTLGAQVSLFDVSDLDRPRRIDTLGLGKDSEAAVAWDSRAFAYDPERGLVSIPVISWEGDDRNVVVSVDMTSGQLSEATRFAIWGDQTRNIFLGDSLVTVDRKQVTSRNLDSFERTGIQVFIPR